MSEPLEINVQPGVPSSRRRVVLDGREYVIDLRWSGREAAFYLDLRSADGTLIVGAIKVVANTALLDDVRGAAVVDLPEGELFAVDRRTAALDPGLDELGDTVLLVYVPATVVLELVAAEAAA